KFLLNIIALIFMRNSSSTIHRNPWLSPASEALGAGVWIAILAVAPGLASTVDNIHQRGQLLWGADMKGGEPYVYEDPQHRDTLIGFEVDIAKDLAKRL